MALLEISHLHTFFKTKKGIVKAVNDVSYQVEEGQTLGVVGESGSGKSVSAMSILKLLDSNGYIDSGKITFNGRDIVHCSMNDMYSIRGNEISVIFQEPMTSLNPVFTIEKQIQEVFQVHQNLYPHASDHHRVWCHHTLHEKESGGISGGGEGKRAKGRHCSRGRQRAACPRV